MYYCLAKRVKRAIMDEAKEKWSIPNTPLGYEKKVSPAHQI